MEGLATHGRWGHNSGKTLEVESITLDTFCKDKKISFIKCDIEGGEYKIFFHGEDMLTNNDLTIILETHQVSNYDSDQKDRNRLQEHFERFGYTVYGVSGNKVDKMDHNTHYLIKRG